MREPRISSGFEGLPSLRPHLKNVFVAAGALFLIIFLVNSYYWAPKKQRVKSGATIYLNKRAEADAARGALISARGDVGRGDVPVTVKTSKMDKIIWSEKLKIIAEAIPEKVWISGIVVRQTPPAMVLSCHVYSYGQDHLDDIALFISNLKKENRVLTKFSNVIFHSALRNKQDPDVYDFTLTFPLKNVMIQKVTENVGKTKG